MSDATASDLPRRVLRDPVHWLAFGGGVGLLPRAPGTWGTLLALAIHWLLPPVPPLAMSGVLAALFIPACWVCGASAKRLGVHDHGGIVLDEIMAMLALLVVTPRTVGWHAVAFILFRTMDIAKPWPIRELDHRLHGGVGIMLDDVLAAIYAAAVVRGLMLLP